MKYYIEYGSNTPQEMGSRCPGAKFLGKVEAPLKLFFNYYATVSPTQDGSKIEVMLYSITSEDERNLDYYEGYPALYKKMRIPIEFEGKRIEALTYFMTHAQTQLFLNILPDQNYLIRCARGYKEAGIPVKQLEDAVLYSVHKLLEDA